MTDLADPSVGLDAKLVWRDSLVLDLTANPDFSQVESDLPQVTVNRRFEVFFPERRPFFIENAGFCRTPIDLVFIRRIADPQLGARLTGKAGPWAIAAMLIDDQAPGRQVPSGDPLHGNRVIFSIGRVSRDVGEQSSVGGIYVGRELGDGHNRVAGVDGRLRLSDRWATSFQAVTSSTRRRSGEELAGPAYEVLVSRTGRRFSYAGGYTDIGRGFRTDAGFVQRSDVRSNRHFLSYFLRPEGERLIFWGFELSAERNWDHDGTILDDELEPSVEWRFVGQSDLEVNYRLARERLRPVDLEDLGLDGVDGGRAFDVDNWDIEYGTSHLDWVRVEGNLRLGRRINLAPPPGAEPSAAAWRELELDVDLRPHTRLRVENRYLYTRLSDRRADARILSDHVLRSRWNWQASHELSFRLIAEYRATLANPALTALTTRKNLNADVLVTYRVNPWTAFFVGFNGNARNLDLVESDDRPRLVPSSSLTHASSQLFVKLSWLLRF